MKRPQHRPAGFTLIELLVVISILALLIAVLVPALGRAGEVGRRAVCAANFRSVGLGFHAFAAMRDGRFPNKGLWDQTNGGNPGRLNPQSGWAPYWESIINWEYFHGNELALYPTPSRSLADEPTIGPIIRFWTFWDTEPIEYKLEYIKKRYATCPNYKAWGQPNPGVGNEWTRPWIANENVTGGYDGVTWYGEYGRPLTNPKAIFWNYSNYGLGTRPDIFANAGNKFMVFESEYGHEILQLNTDSTKGPSGTTTGSVTINDGAGSPPWTAGASFGVGGFFSFRHMLSADRRLYQQEAQATVLYVDGHAGFLNPNQPIALPKRFQPEL